MKKSEIIKSILAFILANPGADDFENRLAEVRYLIGELDMAEYTERRAAEQAARESGKEGTL